MEGCWSDDDEVEATTPAPSNPSFQEEVRARRAAAAWLKWPLPKLVARRWPLVPFIMAENMFWILFENIKKWKIQK